MDTVTINRAPVLTLWAAVVAERLGFEPDEALGRVRGPGEPVSGGRSTLLPHHMDRVPAGEPSSCHATPAIGTEPTDAAIEHVDVPGAIVRQWRYAPAGAPQFLAPGYEIPRDQDGLARVPVGHCPKRNVADQKRA